jgi:hypothetical protein
MANEQKEIEFGTVANYIPHMAMLGAVIGAIWFEFSEITSVIEAILTPVLFSIGTVIAGVLIMLLFAVIDLKLDTESKRFWGAVIVIIISTLICAFNV